jgi:hypothetical protein
MMSSQKFNTGTCEATLRNFPVMNASLASVEQLKPVGSWVSKNLGSNRENSVLLKELNEILSHQHLPTIDTSAPELAIRESAMHGIAFNTQIGVQITDGKHRFCFPCAGAMNQFKWGIVSL